MLRSPPRLTDPRSAKKSKQSSVVKAAYKKRYQKAATVSFGKQLLPWKLANTLVYMDTVPITISSGAYTQYIWSCNGIYDPQTTGAGHQPRGFDQMTALYNHYTVLRSRMVVTFCSNSALAKYRACLFTDDDASSNVTTVDFGAERKGAKYTQWDIINSPKPIRHSYDARSVFGGDPVSDPNLQGSISVNPPEGFFYVLGVEDLDLNTSTIHAVVRIEYDVLWDELKSFSPST